MSQHEDLDHQNVMLEDFLQSNKEHTSPSKSSESMDAETSQELGHQMNTNASSRFRSSSTLTVCPSPQLVPSPHSGSQSVPPYHPQYASPSPTNPTSPATASPTQHPVLGMNTTFQVNRSSNQNSPLQFLSDSESSYTVNKGHRKGRISLQRSLSSIPMKARSTHTSNSSNTLNENSLLQRKLTRPASRSGIFQSGVRMRSISLSPFSLQPMDVNHNLVPENVQFLLKENQTAQSNFQSHSPSTILNPKLEQQGSQDLLSTHSSPHNLCSGIGTTALQDTAASTSTSAQSDWNISGPLKQQSMSCANIGIQSRNPVAGHLPVDSQSPAATQSVSQDESSSHQSPGDAVPPLSFAESYANLTPWTTRLVSGSDSQVPNVNDETLPLNLGSADNLLLFTSAKKNQPQYQQSYGLLNQPYSSLQQTSPDSDGSSNAAKDTYKILPNKQLRFRKTADALQKSGLWEVAMKTGSLIRRNKELQKELDKFRADALVFLKSVIKNPHNWKLIKSILSNALFSNQASSKASPIMTVVVSAAEAAAAAASKLDSAGSSDGGTSSSMCGNASDTSGHSSQSSETALVDNHFASTKQGFPCVDVDMDVN